ncbi:reverse transcriptase domain-containing protein, partial [Dyella sp.]|uniref:reverse transcriptase domain-containing protein n=1 Tax=Dyella sp. TaxID=1869338 RepID=UPI0028527A0F
MDRSPSIGTVDQGDLFRLLRTRVNNGASAGPSGWTGAHLQLIAENGSLEARTGLTMMVKDICNGIFAGHMRHRLVASLLLPLDKRDGGVRPIACGEVFTKLAAHYLMSLIESRLSSLFPRIQFGVKKPGGSESAAQLTRALIDQCRSLHPDVIGLKTDFINAFNNADRAQMFRQLLACEATDPILRMFHWAYAEESPLLVYEHGRLKATLASAQGVRQGDPFAALVFALLVQRLYENAIAEAPDCHAVSVLDDLTLVGPLDQVMRAYDHIVLHAHEYHLQLRTDKCSVYVPPTSDVGQAVDDTRGRIASACASRHLKCQSQMELLGVMLGTDDDVRAHLTSSIDQHQKLFECLRHPAMPVQIGYALLRWCALPRLSYLTRTTDPMIMVRPEMAPRFDRLVTDTFKAMMKIEHDAITHEQITLPITRGGMGLRSVWATSAAAYFSSLASIMPEFAIAFPNSDTAPIDYSQTKLTG